MMSDRDAISYRLTETERIGTKDIIAKINAGLPNSYMFVTIWDEIGMIRALMQILFNHTHGKDIVLIWVANITLYNEILNFFALV